MWVSVRVCRFVVVVVVVSTFVQALLLLHFPCAIVFFLFTAFFALFFLDIGFDFLLWLFRRRRHRCRFLFAMSRLSLCFFSRVFGSFFFSLMNFSHTQNWCDCMILKWQTDCCYTICCYFFLSSLFLSMYSFHWNAAFLPHFCRMLFFILDYGSQLQISFFRTESIGISLLL